MNKEIKTSKGFVVVSHLHMRGKTLSCRSDVDYESHITRVLEEYIQIAKDNNVDILFLGECVKSLSLRQALQVMQYKFEVNMFVLPCDVNSVNPALIEMKCLSILDDALLSIGNHELSLNEPRDTGKALYHNGEQWVVSSANAKGVITHHFVPPAVALNKQDKPGCLLINKNRNPKEICSTVDDISCVIKAPQSEGVSKKLDSTFMVKLKSISDKQHANKGNALDVQSLINDVELGQPKAFVQELYNSVSKKSQQNY